MTVPPDKNCHPQILETESLTAWNLLLDCCPKP